MHFTEACNAKIGDQVAHGGVLCRIERIENKGKDAPYFQLEGTHGNLTSWQVCGKYIPAADAEDNRWSFPVPEPK
jgi:hypothetical protein